MGTKTDKDLERVLVTQNSPSIHYSAGDYFHLSIGGNDSWKDEVMTSAKFVERWMAETDNTIVQLIPYVVCKTPEGKVLSYERRGGNEERLSAMHSVGIGGHVNDTDAIYENGSLSWKTIEEGAIREIVEEVQVSRDYAKENLTEIGTLYVPSNDEGDTSGVGPKVGEVHIGIVYRLDVEPDLRVRSGEGLAKPKFVQEPRNLLRYERWSQFVLQNIDAIREA